MKTSVSTLSAVVTAGLLLSGLPPAVAAQRAAPWSLEQVKGYPFPNELTAAGSGSRIAWAFNERGLRNLWVAEGPAFAARQLTRYQRDDAQELTQVSISSDGRYVVYVRGGEICAYRVHPYEDRLARLRFENSGDRRAGLPLAVRGHGVFEVEDDGIGLTGERLLDLAPVIAGYVEIAPDRRVHRMPLPESSSSSCLPIPSPP